MQTRSQTKRRVVETAATSLAVDRADEDTLSDVALLREASARLVWSRLREVQSLKESLSELSAALHKVETISQRISDEVDKDVTSAMDVATSTLSGRVPVHYPHTFSDFFQDLIAILFRR